MNKILLLFLISGLTLAIVPTFFAVVYPDQVSQLDDIMKNIVAVLFFIGVMLLILVIVGFLISTINGYGFKLQKVNDVS